MTQDWEAHYLKNMRDSVLALDVMTGRLTGFNPATVALFGYDETELTGMHFSALLPPLTANEKTPVGRRFPLSATALESQIFRHASGSEIICDVMVTAVRTTPELAVLHLREVGGRVEAQKALSDKERATQDASNTESIVRAVEQYMSHVSHELRTPLAVILSSSSMLERYYSRLTEAKREEHFQRIQTQVKYLTEFLDNLRLLSRLDANAIAVRLENVDIPASLQEIVNEFGPHPLAPRFDVYIADDVAALDIDGVLWRRALHALIQNAVKYGPVGEIITVSIAARDGHLDAHINDKGTGLPMDYIPHAFEVFRRGENSADILGAGLGLAIASRCAALLKGEITYIYDQTIGATFTLSVPLAN